ncbi:MAG: thioredoxin family protein [Polyangiaceae bacterium]
MRALGVAIVVAALAACTREPRKDAADGASSTIARDPVAASAPASGAPSAAPAPSPVTSASTAPAEARGPRVVVAPEDADAPSFIRAQRLKAKSEGRVLVVYAGAKWCPPCKKLEAELARGAYDESLSHVTLLKFDADRDTDRLAVLGYKIDFIPYAALPGADGRPTAAVRATGKGAGAYQEVVAKLVDWDRAR